MPLPFFPVRVSPLTLASLALVLGGCKGCKGETNLVTTKSEDSGDPVEDTFDNDWGQWLSLAAMPDGTPALSYYDNTRGALGFALATVDGDSVEWTHEEVDGYVNEEGLDVGDRGKYSSMAIADTGAVWIAYYDVINQTLRYALRSSDDETWTSGLADAGGGATPNAGLFASIALDGSGQPVIAHHDEGKGELRVVRWKGAAFEGETVDEGEDVAGDSGTDDIEADVGEFAAVAVGDDGTTYVAYYDRALGDLKLAHGTEGDWSVEVVASTGDVGQWPDLMVDGSTIHIAFHDVENQDLLYASGSPGSWTVEPVDQGNLVGADTAIFQGAQGLSILYFDGYENDMKRATRSGDAWAIETITGADAAHGFHNEALVTDGGSFAACYDYTSRNVWFSAVD